MDNIPSPRESVCGGMTPVNPPNSMDVGDSGSQQLFQVLVKGCLDNRPRLLNVTSAMTVIQLQQSVAALAGHSVQGLCVNGKPLNTRVTLATVGLTCAGSMPVLQVEVGGLVGGMNVAQATPKLDPLKMHWKEIFEQELEEFIDDARIDFLKSTGGWEEAKEAFQYARDVNPPSGSLIVMLIRDKDAWTAVTQRVPRPGSETSETSVPEAPASNQSAISTDPPMSGDADVRFSAGAFKPSSPPVAAERATDTQHPTTSTQSSDLHQMASHPLYFVEESRIDAVVKAVKALVSNLQEPMPLAAPAARVLVGCAQSPGTGKTAFAMNLISMLRFNPEVRQRLGAYLPTRAFQRLEKTVTVFVDMSDLSKPDMTAPFDAGRDFGTALACLVFNTLKKRFEHAEEISFSAYYQNPNAARTVVNVLERFFRVHGESVPALFLVFDDLQEIESSDYDNFIWYKPHSQEESVAAYHNRYEKFWRSMLRSLSHPRVASFACGTSSATLVSLNRMPNSPVSLARIFLPPLTKEHIGMVLKNSMLWSDDHTNHSSIAERLRHRHGDKVDWDILEQQLFLWTGGVALMVEYTCDGLLFAPMPERQLTTEAAISMYLSDRVFSYVKENRATVFTSETTWDSAALPTYFALFLMANMGIPVKEQANIPIGDRRVPITSLVEECGVAIIESKLSSDTSSRLLYLRFSGFLARIFEVSEKVNATSHLTAFISPLLRWSPVLDKGNVLENATRMMLVLRLTLSSLAGGLPLNNALALPMWRSSLGNIEFPAHMPVKLSFLPAMTEESNVRMFAKGIDHVREISGMSPVSVVPFSFYGPDMLSKKAHVCEWSQILEHLFPEWSIGVPGSQSRGPDLLLRLSGYNLVGFPCKFTKLYPLMVREEIEKAAHILEAHTDAHLTLIFVAESLSPQLECCQDQQFATGIWEFDSQDETVIRREPDSQDSPKSPWKFEVPSGMEVIILGSNGMSQLLGANEYYALKQVHKSDAHSDLVMASLIDFITHLMCRTPTKHVAGTAKLASSVMEEAVPFVPPDEPSTAGISCSTSTTATQSAPSALTPNILLGKRKLDESW